MQLNAASVQYQERVEAGGEPRPSGRALSNGAAVAAVATCTAADVADSIKNLILDTPPAMPQQPRVAPRANGKVVSSCPAAAREPNGCHSSSSSSSSWSWGAFQEMVVFGLGSPEADAVPRCQLAFALLLRECMPGLRSPVQAFDPVFSPVDRLLLKSFDIQVRSRVPVRLPIIYSVYCWPRGEFVAKRKLVSCWWCA